MTSPSNRKAVPALLALLLPLLTLVACNSAYTGTNPGTGTNYPFLSAVTLQPGSAPSIAVAGTVQVGANGAYQVSATEIQYNDVTTSATWSSSNDAVATVSKGLVTGTGIGSATISASLNGKTGKTLVVVGQTATLDITATGTGVFSLSANPDQHFQASASYSDGAGSHHLCNLELKRARSPEVLPFFRLHARPRGGYAPGHGDDYHYRNPGLRRRGGLGRDSGPIGVPRAQDPIGN